MGDDLPTQLFASPTQSPSILPPKMATQAFQFGPHAKFQYRPADFLDFDPRKSKKPPRRVAKCKNSFGSPTRARTWDLRINSPLLYQLSYQGIDKAAPLPPPHPPNIASNNLLAVS